MNIYMLLALSISGWDTRYFSVESILQDEDGVDKLLTTATLMNNIQACRDLKTAMQGKQIKGELEGIRMQDDKVLYAEYLSDRLDTSHAR